MNKYTMNKKMTDEELIKYFKKIRNNFPILNQKVHGKNLVYTDNGATSQKPQIMIDAIVDYYTNYNSNVHRGLHTLSEKATTEYELVRKKTANFVNSNTDEIVFTSGTTQSLNIIAHGLVNQIKENDEIVISQMEHHANLVTWQQLALKTGAKLKYIHVLENGELDLIQAEKIINKKTKIISLTHISNVLGTINPIKKVIELANLVGALSVIDGAQSIGHMPIDVKKLGCDFLVFSAHKMCGPTGVGILYGKMTSLEKLTPNTFGGDMILEVEFEKSTFNKIPYCFEAGTPNIADTIAFGKVLDYLSKIGIKNIENYDKILTKYFLKQIKDLEKDYGFKFYGPKSISKKAAVFSFTIKGVHSHDISTILDKFGIAVRGGHHCAMPLTNDVLGVVATSRISFYFYNTIDEIDYIINCLKKIRLEFEKGEFLF
jgi:cysteine desulfurase/selenocysteine lyase